MAVFAVLSPQYYVLLLTISFLAKHGSFFGLEIKLFKFVVIIKPVWSFSRISSLKAAIINVSKALMCAEWYSGSGGTQLSTLTSDSPS